MSQQVKVRPKYPRPSLLLLFVLFGVAIGALFPIARWKAEKRRAKLAAESKQQGSEGEPNVLGNDDLKIKQWHYHPKLDAEIAQFESVFWEPEDTTSLLQWIEDNSEDETCRVLEIGCGSGLVSLVCRKIGIEDVVATDINPAAVANALYNAEHLGISGGLDVRKVPSSRPGAFSVVEPSEKFDWILSNPPWEDRPVEEVAAYALYDPGFALMDSILAEAGTHLKQGGQLLLAYGARAAIERILSEAPRQGWTVEILDARDLSGLPEVFVPAMLLRLVPSKESTRLP